MYLVTERTVEAFADAHADARDALRTWVGQVRVARWATADDAVRALPGRVRSLGQDRLLFDIRGNHYRIVCSVRWADPSRNLNGVVRVEFIGTHAEYNDVDARTVVFSNPGSRRRTS